MMNKVKCIGCKGEYDEEDMTIQDANTVYCPFCDYENSAKQDAKDDEHN